MAELEEQAMPSRKKRVFACMRHPVRSLRGYLDACSVKSAFFFYALIGSLAAFAISAVASMALASLSEDVLLNGSGVYPGLYIYDEEENALVKAEDMSWYEAAEGEFTNYANGDEPIVVEGVSLYIESRLSKSESRYRYVIPLNDVPKEAEGIVVHDMDERIVDQGEARDTSIPLDELPAYDAAANAQRGNAVALEAQLPSDSEGNRPAASLVGYYVYVPTTGPAYQAINFLIIVMVPIVFGVCFILASHAFYKRKLQRPIQAMDEAARRIAEGDLSVSMPAPCAGSKSELDRLCASFETMRDALERNNKAMWRMAENRRKVNAAFAHDLRTPLTVLKGRAEMLSTFAPEGLVDAEQLAEASSAMTRQTERLQRYVESMKDLVDMDECSVAPHAGNVGVWFVRAAGEGERPASFCELRRYCAVTRGGKHSVERAALCRLQGEPCVRVGRRGAYGARFRRRPRLCRRRACPRLRALLARGLRKASRRFRSFRPGSQHLRRAVREARRRRETVERGIGGRRGGGVCGSAACGRIALLLPEWLVSAPLLFVDVELIFAF